MSAPEDWTPEDATRAATYGWCVVESGCRYAIERLSGNRYPSNHELVGCIYTFIQIEPKHPISEFYRKALALHGQPVPKPEPTLIERLRAVTEESQNARPWTTEQLCREAANALEAKSATDERLRQEVQKFIKDSGPPISIKSSYHGLYNVAKDAGIVT